MKKLLIAAGIAAATMASFNASAAAHAYDVNSLSHASVNSVVTGSSIVTVSGTNGESYDTTDILASGKNLGSFGIKLPYGALGFGISSIHSHGFPEDFKVKFGTDCVVKVQSGNMVVDGAVADTPAENGLLPQQCLFDNTVTSVDVTTETNTGAKVAPGTKTITADFTAYTN
ncbi:hypothetical protein PJP32_000546 [Salmonella enterica]|nr:hypothetical protein [Salmonella enterica subsp. enterica serovar Singapore]EDR3737653.1 hypothetical protein [Salmonella enterica subsp. enterica serovar Singapore]EKJ6073478.1 hypothetical protein [Salmonella enterica]EKJ6084459.1 hypothetical protein [Salmonella enterica]MDJ6852451.1 hypothetical protein [Salmonella enterica]